jgi:isopentenyl-diphosphate delta-isomerase type 2
MDTVTTDTPPSSTIGFRKEKHLAICTDPARFTVEGADSGFSGLRFLHRALPELAAGQIDPSCRFLEHRLRLPLFISCMTGGSEAGLSVNQELARAAQTAGLPVGLGSFRVLFEHPELAGQFQLKKLAPDVPVLANLGAVQVRDRPQAEIFEWLRRLEVQALVVHLNPGQELFQPEGDDDFRGLKQAIARLCEGSPVPVIVKETGFGLLPSLVRELLDAGAAYVDLAGAGGTNWIRVEAYRLTGEARASAEEFADWGLPTAVLLGALRGTDRVLASGGLRSGLDAAKAVALGARLAGMALPFIREVCAGGAEAVGALIRRLEHSFRTAMLLTGSRTLEDLRRGVLWAEPGFTAAVEALRAADLQERP